MKVEDYQQPRCKHGWILENSQCPDCKEIKAIEEERDRLKADNAKLQAFWDWSREADKMTFEQYHWTKQALRGGEGA